MHSGSMKSRKFIFFLYLWIKKKERFSKYKNWYCFHLNYGVHLWWVSNEVKEITKNRRKSVKTTVLCTTPLYHWWFLCTVCNALVKNLWNSPPIRTLIFFRFETHVPLTPLFSQYRHVNCKKTYVSIYSHTLVNSTKYLQTINFIYVKKW